jgi:hypothetical protein
MVQNDGYPLLQKLNRVCNMEFGMLAIRVKKENNLSPISKAKLSEFNKHFLNKEYEKKGGKNKEKCGSCSTASTSSSRDSESSIYSTTKNMKNDYSISLKPIIGRSSLQPIIQSPSPKDIKVDEMRSDNMRKSRGEKFSPSNTTVRRKKSISPIVKVVYCMKGDLDSFGTRRSGRRHFSQHLNSDDVITNILRPAGVEFNFHRNQ